MLELCCGGRGYITKTGDHQGRMRVWDGPVLMRQHQDAPDLTHNPLVQADRRG